VWVLGIKRRPPYDYEDLADLVDVIVEQTILRVDSISFKLSWRLVSFQDGVS
jgi:hypothetical protein